MYRDDTIYSRGKVVEDRMVDVRRYIIANEITREGMLISFQQRLIRLLETETTSTLSTSSEVLKEGPTHNDFYGFFTSQQEVLLAAVRRKIDPKSEIKCEVRTTVTDRWVAPHENVDMDRWLERGKYRQVPEDWIIVGSGLNSEANIEKWSKLSWDERFDIAPTRVNSEKGRSFLIWTSALEPEGNRKLYGEALERFRYMNALTEDECADMLAKYDTEMGAALSA